LQLSIIIVNYNVKYFLEQCLASVQLAVQGLEAEVYVVDNHSSDGSVAYLQALFPQVNFIALDHNPGFARANNLALARCRGRYVLFLNPDTIVAEDTFSKALAFMEAHTDAGALGIRMVDGSGRFLPESKRGFPTPWAALCKQLGLYRLFPNSAIMNHYYLGHLPPNNSHPVEVLAGAFMLVKKMVLDQVGSFDEQFFMYGEDIDLSYRITQAGYRNYYFASSTIIHFKGESTSRHSLQYVRVFYQAMQLFVTKHFKGTGAGLYRVMLYAGIGLRASIGTMSRLFTRKSQNLPMPPDVALKAEGWPAGMQLPVAMRVGEQRVVLHDAAAETFPSCCVLVVGNSLSLWAAIGKLESLGAHTPCWLHVANTRSMVMSSNKAAAGLAGEFCG
jgi:GT2 family glycosyltransferase